MENVQHREKPAAAAGTWTRQGVGKLLVGSRGRSWNCVEYFCTWRLNDQIGSFDSTGNGSDWKESMKNGALTRLCGTLIGHYPRLK